MAQGNLDDILDTIASDNPTAALSMANAILERIARLTTHPNLGRSGRVPGTRELVIVNTPFLVAYVIRDDVVTILRILHERRQWPPTLT